MSLLYSYYLDNNSVNEWKEKYSSAAQEYIMYCFKGTNGRTLSSFSSKFLKFEEVEGIKRNEWPVSSTTGQEKHKQYTKPMVHSRLFYAQDNENYFYKTEKGKIYKSFLDLDFNDDEKWLINYLFLLDSNFNNKENYLMTRSEEIYNTLVSNTSELFVSKAFSEMFIEKNNHISDEEAALYDFLYLDSFYLEPAFLKLYYEADEFEREELKKYVSNNLRENNRNCCICNKFLSPTGSTGNYSVNELIDDLKILMFSLSLKEIRFSSFEETIKSIIELFRTDYDIDKENVYKFVLEQRSIFEPIIMNLYDIEELEDSSEDSEIVDNTNVSVVELNDIPEKWIDDTTVLGKQYLNRLFNQRKPIVKSKSGYKCELEQFNRCNYFTSKVTKQNYLEVHHFIPREFRNKFEYSIDVMANYVALCPHCHRMLEKAVDRERISLISFLYNQRIERLKQCGLDVEFDDILRFYKID